MEFLADYRESIQRIDQLLPQAGAGRWSTPTPCNEWDLRTLVNHVVLGMRMYGTLASGREFEPGEGPSDVLGPDPRAAFAQASRTAIDGFATPGAADRVLRLPIGNLPGSVAITIALAETTVHGWDIAKATNRQLHVPWAVVDHIDHVMRQTVGPQMRQPNGKLPVFAPEVPIADNASPIDRLVAFLGRAP